MNSLVANSIRVSPNSYYHLRAQKFVLLPAGYLTSTSFKTLEKRLCSKGEIRFFCPARSRIMCAKVLFAMARVCISLQNLTFLRVHVKIVLQRGCLYKHWNRSEFNLWNLVDVFTLKQLDADNGKGTYYNPGLTKKKRKISPGKERGSSSPCEKNDSVWRTERILQYEIIEKTISHEFCRSKCLCRSGFL